jgi:general secretion pathway protein G
VVLAILALLATFAVPQVMKVFGGAKSDAAKIQVSNLSTALDMYRLDVGRYPSQDMGLGALVSRPGDSEKWNGPYVKKRESLLDPWGKAYIYRFPGQHAAYDIYSLGSDGVEGGEGEARDLTTW